MRVRCAWCGREYSTPSTTDIPIDSDGICEECAASMEEELAEDTVEQAEG